MSADRAGAAGWARAIRSAPLVAFLVLLSAYHAAFGRYFPAASGTIGSDYALTLPDLLSGYFWFATNGLWAVPWFTPAFCGGQPAFADPQAGYYSVLQFATFFVDPLTSAYLTMLLFAAAGYWGCYVLLRRAFAVGQFAAILGAAAFMFNGFFAHRMLVGHAGYQGFMLVPWIPYLLTLSPAAEGRRWLSGLAAACAVGMIAAYWLQSGLATLMIPMTLAVVAILLLHAYTVDPFPWGQVVLRSLLGGVVACSISAAKLVAAASTMAQFPRADYLLPGYRNMADALRIAFTSLFLSPTDIASLSNAVLENVQWRLDRHELEYGVTVVPLLIVAAGLVCGLWRVLARRTRVRVDAKRIGLVACLCLIMIVPLALNTYSPEWNATLKKIPVLQSASNLVRWYCVYIPVVVVLCALCVAAWPARVQVPVAVIGLTALIALNLVQDRTWYTQDGYLPEPIIRAYRAVHAGNAPPPIHDIAVFVNRDGRATLPANRNDTLVAGMSQLLCYNPIFGYRLERFPVGNLHPGPVRQVTDGHYNIKNPACYVYPKENGCVPGDHFRDDQTEAMEDFVAYRPYAFEMSRTQRVANAVTLLALALSVLIVVIASGFMLKSRISRRSKEAALRPRSAP